MEDGGELSNFLNVWTVEIASLSYCYTIGKFVPSGPFRLVAVFPVLSLNLYLPLLLTSIHLGGMSSFLLAWLANFKLLLFAFSRGPLSSDPSISLPRFVAVGCLPIKPRSRIESVRQNTKSATNYAVKLFLMGILLQVYPYGNLLPPKFLFILYGFHVYFALELMLALAAYSARAAFGMELEPQFDEPYLSTSLQDFWGRRWNLMVTTILRPAVYEPVLGISARLLGRKWASLPAVMGTFVVSGLMHELIFFHLGRAWPTWEITWFFLLHGAFLVAEIALKKTVAGRCQLPRPVTSIVTVGLVMGTAIWLFFPQLLRCKADTRALAEYVAVGEYLENVVRLFFPGSFFRDATVQER